MVIDRQIFEYQNNKLIERVIIKPPFRYEAIFQNEGCFIYVKGLDSKILSADDNLEINNKEAVLLKCGTYFIDWLKKTDDNTVEVIAVHLYPEVLKQLYDKELPQLIEQRHIKTETQRIIPEDTLSKFIDSLAFYFDNPSLVNDDLLALKIKELILLLIQTENAESVLQLITDLYSPRITNLKRVVDLHLYSNLSVEELAKLCNLSLSAFKREFNKAFNDSPINYLNTEKLKKAKHLLQLSDSPINAIAYEVGYNDPLYFTRLFKKKTGLSPSIFREKHTN